MNDNAELSEFANNLWKNFIEKKIDEKLNKYVSFGRATVVSNNSGSGRLTISRPYDNDITIPCVDSLKDVSVGSQVTIFNLGKNNKANMVAVGNGTLSELGGSVSQEQIDDLDERVDVVEGDVSSLNTTVGKLTTNSTVVNDANDATSGNILYDIPSTGTNIPQAVHYFLFNRVDNNGNIAQFATRVDGYANTWKRYYVASTGTWTVWNLFLTENEFSKTLSRSSLTPASSRCTINSGGYFEIGNMVFIQLQATISTAVATGAQNIITGFPNASTNVAVACECNQTDIDVDAHISTSGVLVCIVKRAALASGDIIRISGWYQKATPSAVSPNAPAQPNA